MVNALTRNDGQNVLLEDAILAYTLNSAIAMGHDDRVGSIEVGKRADFIVLDRDILSVTTAQLGNTAVLATLVDGEIVFRALSTGTAGDPNSDGFVGAEDLDILLANWGQAVPTGSLIHGDSKADGAIGNADLQWVLANWGNGTPPGTVPEPSTFAILLVAGGLLIRRRRGTHSAIE